MLSSDEILSLPIGQLQAAYRKYSRQIIYDYKEHVELAKKLGEANKLPTSFMAIAPGSWSDDVWDDILRMRTLNGEQSRRKLQLHLCCLQLDIIERIINRFSNQGETVFDPFAGLFSVPYMAVKMGRKGHGVELNTDYFRDGIGYLKRAEQELSTPTLFDFMEGEE